MWCLTDLADHLGLSICSMKHRVENWPPERWAEPMKSQFSRKKKPAVKQLTEAEIKLRKPYTDDELLELYRAFKGAPDELTRLADFMASDVEAASTKIIRWEVEGRI